MKTLDKVIVKTADVLKTLGHPARVEILRLISGSKTQQLTVKEIQAQLKITQPETSKHLVLMKNLSVLLCERKNGHSFYRINDEHTFIRNIINHVKIK
jgi:DNA-binding transcriptional ArsR family regulator